MEHYVCVHGHFYQPPRENPWLEAIELQDSAHPYHDWNERITAECYAPNGSSRILDAERRIERIVNNYSRISFNFGPTLLSWLEQESPRTYRAILDADTESARRFSGHGSALAQVYNHMILPLANRRDKQTQVCWGIRDFEHRFGRRPEGMWLAETAADAESLDVLAEQGIRFTILAPRQARRFREAGAHNWRSATGGRIDPTRCYEIRLPSRRSIAAFFYDGPISRAVAFEGLLTDGERFAGRILSGLNDARNWPQLVHIATDGETYGHHHRDGDMALAYALQTIESNPDVRLTNYGEYLERHPPAHRAEIFDRSSWSCVHGVDRWWSDCGCNSGGHRGWNQAWRTPLRNALDWLRDTLASPYESRGRELLADPWAARDDYIDVVLDRSAESLERFWSRHASRPLNDGEKVTALKLLELQRHAMLMYTSCGWFFDELSGIETVQVMQYAGRVIQLAQEALGQDHEPAFLERLAAARSNIAEHGDGARIYQKFVKTTMIDIRKVAAHYAISSVFANGGDKTSVNCYHVEPSRTHRLEAGKSRLLVGRAMITSRITTESADVSFGVLHFGDQNIQAGVREFRGEEAYDRLVQETGEALGRGDLTEVVRLLDRHFDGVTDSLRTLFRDEQRRIVEMILESTLADVETRFRAVYDQSATLMRFLADIGVPPPKPLRAAAEFVTHMSLRRALDAESPDMDHVQALLESAAKERVTLDDEEIGLRMGGALERMVASLRRTPADVPLLRHTVEMARRIQAMPLKINLWKVQNAYYEMLSKDYPEYRSRTDEEGRAWADLFGSLGEILSVRVH